MSKSVQINHPLREWMDVFMHRSWRSWRHYAKSTGLSMEQFSVMMQLHHHGSCGMSRISDRFETTPAAASQLVEKLVQSGYIERTEDPSDRRAKLLQLSPRGREVIQAGFHERHRWMDELMKALTPEERIKVNEALSILTRTVRQFDEQG